MTSKFCAARAMAANDIQRLGMEGDTLVDRHQSIIDLNGLCSARHSVTGPQNSLIRELNRQDSKDEAAYYTKWRYPSISTQPSNTLLGTSISPRSISSRSQPWGREKRVLACRLGATSAAVILEGCLWLKCRAASCATIISHTEE